MESENAVGLVALAWLIGGLLLMGRSIRRGQKLADALATRHPEVYQELGRPRPGYLQSARRDRFAQFVARRGFEELSDPVLAERFEAYRTSEARLVLSLIGSLLVVGLLVLIVRRVA